MIKSYKLKIYANKNKIQNLNNLICFWKLEVQRKIDLFWAFNEVKGSYCPAQYTSGGRLIRDASTKAWQIVKIAKKLNLEKPVFKGNEIDLNPASIRFLDFKTKEFDFWVKITHLEKRNRIALPCKRIGIFNKALDFGILKKSAKLIKVKNKFYLQIYIELKESEIRANKILGLDVGLTNTVADSNGKFFGNDLQDLRIRTKWRKYPKKITPFKQGLNRVAKEIVDFYPDTNFVVENLLFKGKKKRTKTFRRRNNNWAYAHLGKTLERNGKLKGFQIFRVHPEYSSQTCPECAFIDIANRVGDKFLCKQCGYSNHADTVGALNLLERVAQERSVPVTKEGG